MIKIEITWESDFAPDYYLKVYNGNEKIYDARYCSYTDLHRTANELAHMFNLLGHTTDLADLSK